MKVSGTFLRLGIHVTLLCSGFGSPTGLASLNDYMGDIRFAAGVASKWVVSDEPFVELAQLQVRDVRRLRRQVTNLLNHEVTKKHEDYSDIIPSWSSVSFVVSFVEFGEEETAGQSTYEMIRNDSGELIGIVITDSNGRITLFTLYPAVGGTLIISISYDTEGNEVSKIFTSYDSEGNIVERADLLVVEKNSIKSSSPLRVSSSTSWLDEPSILGGGGMRMMSAPEGPQLAAEEFIYDHLGNRYLHTDKNGVIWTFTHNGVNQYEQAVLDYPLVPDETVAFAHDDNGNLSEDWYGHGYSYDYRNRLTEVGGIAGYGYDTLGRRISKYDEDKNLTTYFYYDTFGRVIAEYEKPDGGDEAFARSVVYGNGFNEVLAMFTPYHAGDASDMSAFVAFCDAWLCTDPNDGCYDEAYDHNDDDVIDFEDFAWFASIWDLPSSRESNWYYLRDAVGSIRGVIGGRFGREEDREFYNYDAYGQLSLQNPEESKCGNPYLFAGYRYDPEAGLYYVVNRTYDIETGRFLQPDPIGYADSMNLYEYVMSNPTNWVDPWGLWTYGGMYDAFWRKYGDEGQHLLSFADEQDIVPVKRDYWLHDWYYEMDGTLGIASKWADWSLSWSPRIWDDSDETAAKQLYAALKDKYGRTAGKVINCLCKLTPTYHWARQARDDPGFFEGPDMQALGGDVIRMEARASMLGSYVQNEAVAEAQWWLAAAIGGHIAGQAFDALDDCLDARRLAKAAQKSTTPQQFRWFKSFDALKRGLGSPGEGNVWHHVVEQRPANINLFGPEAIHNTQNVLSVPRQVNQAVANYYSSIPRSGFTGGRTVRDWVGIQSWRQQYEFGVDMLNRVSTGTPLP